MPAASNKIESKTSPEVVDPTKQFLNLVDKKVRNIEKRKVSCISLNSECRVPWLPGETKISITFSVDPRDVWYVYFVWFWWTRQFTLSCLEVCCVAFPQVSVLLSLCHTLLRLALVLICKSKMAATTSMGRELHMVDHVHFFFFQWEQSRSSWRLFFATILRYRSMGVFCTTVCWKNTRSLI